MKTHKTLYWAEHIGRNQYRLRIQWHDSYDKNQWFVFDSRTKTIRAWSRRSYMIANQWNYKFRIGVAATIRPYTGSNYDKIRWYSTSRRNIQNNGRKCLAVHGASNTDQRYVTFWNCANSLHMAWWIDQRHKSWPRQPLKDGVRFQIRTRMRSKRSLFWHEHIGGTQYRLRIHNHQPWNLRQWWFFDRRTRTIRPIQKRNFVISNQRGQRHKINRAVVIRQYARESSQMFAFYGGSYRNIRNVPGNCLSVHGNSDSNHRHVVTWTCHNGANQGWTIDRQGIQYPRYPLADGVRFQIRSRQSANRAVFVAEHIGSHQYRLRIQNFNPYDNKQWFIFNWRTRTIRYAANARRVVSIQLNGRNWHYNSYAAVVRQYKGEMLQKMRWYTGSRRTIRDVGERCLHVGANRHRYHLQWYKCNKAYAQQGWYIDRKGFNYPKQPLRPGVRFQIRSIVFGERTVYKSKHHMGGGQYYAKIQDHNPSMREQWMTFDLRTQSIRMFYARNMVIGNRVGYGRRPNNYVTFRPYKGRFEDRIRWVNRGMKSGNMQAQIRSLGGYCMKPNGNTHNNYILMRTCVNRNGHLNNFWIDQVAFRYSRQPFGDNVKFRIR